MTSTFYWNLDILRSMMKNPGFYWNPLFYPLLNPGRGRSPDFRLGPRGPPRRSRGVFLLDESGRPHWVSADTILDRRDGSASLLFPYVASTDTALLLNLILTGGTESTPLPPAFLSPRPSGEGGGNFLLQGGRWSPGSSHCLYWHCREVGTNLIITTWCDESPGSLPGLLRNLTAVEGREKCGPSHRSLRVKLYASHLDSPGVEGDHSSPWGVQVE